jgi:D-aspartate ligase
MTDLGQELGTRAVLISTADKFVLPCDAFAGELNQYYIFAQPPALLRTRLTSKRETFRLAAHHGFPIPRTCFPQSEQDVMAFIDEARFPCLIKPEFSPSWLNADVGSPMYEKKVLVAETPGELLTCYRQATELDSRVVVQEVIPGPDESLLYFVCYLSREQEMLGAFTGRKVRVTPIHFGSASYVQTIYDKELEDQCLHFLKAVGYWGVCGVEVKRDEGDGRLRLVEINPRYGLWDEVGQYIGVDIGNIAYRDLLGLPVTAVRACRPDYRWVSLGRDLRTFFEYKEEGLIDARSWLASLRRPILWTDVTLSDMPLTCHVLSDLFFGVFRRLWRAWGKA